MKIHRSPSIQIIDYDLHVPKLKWNKFHVNWNHCTWQPSKSRYEGM